MTDLLSAAGLTFLKVFVASLIVLGPGILNAPDLHSAELLATAALYSSLAAGFKAIQVYVPDLTFASIVPAPYGAWLDAFVQAFLGTLITSVIGILSAPDLSGWKVIVTSLLVGAFSAGLRALQGLLTKTELPKIGFGFPAPVADKVAPPKRVIRHTNNVA